MKINYPAELDKLASYFSCANPLYIVGGFVRDSIMDRSSQGDIDLSSAVVPQELISMLKDSPFKLSTASKRLGTIIIHGSLNYEYTTFRIDSYPDKSGEHIPNNVIFCDDITVDAKRRDFRCNAIYYDINNQKLVDPLDGIVDIHNKILSTCMPPQVTLSQDGLRIMRLFRFCCQLDFDIDRSTLAAASDNVLLLKDIATERITGELNRLLDCDNCYYGLSLMNTSGVLKMILPQLADNDKTPQNPKYHRYDVLDHIFKTVQNSPKNIRLAALMHDIAKTYCLNKYGNMYLHAKVGADMTLAILSDLKYPVNVIKKTVRLVQNHMFNMDRSAKTHTCKTFVLKNFDILPDIIALKKADSLSSGFDYDCNNIQVLQDIYDDAIALNLPTQVRNLAINGNDLIKIGYSSLAIGKTLKEMLEMCFTQQLPNQKDCLIEWATKHYNNTKD